MRILGFFIVFILFLVANLLSVYLIPSGVGIIALLYVLLLSLFFSVITYIGIIYVFERHIRWMIDNVKKAIDYIRNPYMRYPIEEATSEFMNNILEVLRKKEEEIKRDLAKRDEFIRWLTEEVNRCSFELNRKNKELIEKEKNIALWHLVATIAHKLGTPLNSISGHIQLILANSKIDYETRSRLSIISQELTRIEKIIRQALDVLILDKQKNERINLREFLSEIVDFLLPSLQKDVESIELNIESDFTVVYSDPDMLREVIINLISNANEAIQGKGLIRIVAGRIDNENCYIRVIDNGIGISSELRDKIFEPFFTTKHKGKASGLGLTICREIARAMGGDVEVESTVGKGSVFTFKFKDRREGRV